MKICTRCGESKPLEQYLAVAGYRGGRRSWCKACCAEHTKKWGVSYRAANREQLNKKTRDWHSQNSQWESEYAKRRRLENPEHMRKLDRKGNLSKYGITIEQYETLYRAQNGVCKICHGLNVSGRVLAVDHDHATKKVRGLLCSSCNMAIGLFKDNLDLMRRAFEYIEGVVPL